MMSYFRTQLLSLSLLVGVATPWAATAQALISSVDSGTVEDRVTTLERISDAQAQLLQQLRQQLSGTQRDLDSLRGQIQENQYQLKQLSERQKDLFNQIDKLSSNTTRPPAADTGADNAASVGSDAVAGNSAQAQTGDAKKDYNAAVVLVLEKKQYDQAISAFQAFVKHYPDSAYQPNAGYWLGQLSYNKGKKDDAAYYFASVVKNYPESPKSADALYKVGVIMQEKGDSAKAKAVFRQVLRQYPDTAAAKQAQKRAASL